MCTRITAAGCSLTSIICAFLGCGIKPLEATAFVFYQQYTIHIQALSCFAIASEMAMEKAKGPGSLRV